MPTDCLRTAPAAALAPAGPPADAFPPPGRPSAVVRSGYPTAHPDYGARWHVRSRTVGDGTGRVSAGVEWPSPGGAFVGVTGQGVPDDD